MHVITARNVHEALPLGIDYLQRHGIRRDSRNGPVYQAPTPVTTVYERPEERVVFWPERDANPFFHLYESLWMLAGRNDLAPLVKFAKQVANYSDDGKTVNGAYGYRWRNVYDPTDQLTTIARILSKNHDDRRCVLQMWDASTDLGSSSKDVPCNTMATFQISPGDGALDLTVFCRSNDIIWGAYGANAVHFSVLLEYMANWIGVPMGRYYQVSINWHGYLNTFEPLKDLSLRAGLPGEGSPYNSNHYTKVRPMLFPKHADIEEIDKQIHAVLDYVDNDHSMVAFKTFGGWEFFDTIATLFFAHHLFKKNEAPRRYEVALETINRECGKDLDWVVACREWLERRYAAWRLKNPNASSGYPITEKGGR